MTAAPGNPTALYADLFGSRDVPAGLDDVVRSRRRQAFERFEGRGMPAGRSEEWRQTNLGPLLRRAPAFAARVNPVELDAAAFLYPECSRMVFVNGRYVPEASSLPEEMMATPLSGMPASGDARELVARHLGDSVDGRASCSADAGVHPFAALNTGAFEDGAVIGIPAGAMIEQPLQVLWLSQPAPAAGAADGAEPPVEVSFPRLLVVAGENSQATVIETFAAADPTTSYFSCPAAEFVCEAGSVLHHTRLQVEADAAFHLGFQHTRLARSARFDSASLAFGGSLVRNDTVALLDGAGADCTLDGLYVVSGARFVDNHMRVEHREPHCLSHQLYKGILRDRSRSVFNGRIYVHQAAQKTDAKQTNRNLLLSDAALANSNPQLEIFADDVRCTHGSTIGRLDEDALFYLRARGIPRDEAHRILVYAFARELVEKTSFEPLCRDLEDRLFSSLNGAGRGQDG